LQALIHRWMSLVWLPLKAAQSWLLAARLLPVVTPVALSLWSVARRVQLVLAVQLPSLVVLVAQHLVLVAKRN
jgi:hypothetical protein